MNYCRETVKLVVPQGNRPACRGIGPEAHLIGRSQGAVPEDSRKDGHITRARCAPLSPASGFPVSSRSLRSAQPRKRVPSFAVTASDS